MLFDERPKERLRDFYDREEELKSLYELIKSCKPLILVLGLRRTGKTSLVKVALNEVNIPYILVDCRVFEERIAITSRDFIRAFERSLNYLTKKRNKIMNYLRIIKGVSITGLRVEFRWNSRERVSLVEVLEALNQYGEDEDRCVVVALDEAQELSKLRGINVLSILGYAYDNLKRISFILTGSKIGLLYRFMRVDDPTSPIYGRVRYEVFLKNFSKEKSLDFLKRGFEQAGMKVESRILEEAVDKLDGVVGWLTYFGTLSLRYGASSKTIKRTLEEGSKLALQELKNFLKLRPIAEARYKLILKRIAQEECSWRDIKSYIEMKLGMISDSNLALLLKQLLDVGFIEKRGRTYAIADPILRYAVNRYL